MKSKRKVEVFMEILLVIGLYDVQRRKMYVGGGRFLDYVREWERTEKVFFSRWSESEQTICEWCVAHC